MSVGFFPRTAVLAAALVALTAVGSAQAQALVGLTSSNQITRFNATTPGTSTSVAITGLLAGERFVGLDLRPSNNTIYGITFSNRIYTVNEFTGAATFVAAMSSAAVTGFQGWGIDFNPVADFAGTASLRLVGSGGGNFGVNANTGAVTTGTPVATGYTGVSYTNSSTTGAPASTGLYYINSTTDTLSFAATGFNNPTITTIGSLGVDVLSANGFEVLSNGTAFAALNVDNGSAATSLYSINLGTGAATLLGQYNGTLSGLTISVVPEPGTYALMLAGLGLVGFSAKRRLGRVSR